MTATYRRSAGSAALGAVLLLAAASAACGVSGRGARPAEVSAVTSPRRGTSVPPTTAPPATAPSATAPPTTTTAPPAPAWPARTLVTGSSTGAVAPTTTALYWLQDTSAPTSKLETVTPVRYDLATGQVTRGTPVTAAPGSPQITVTGGLVWTLVADGSTLVARALDPVTLRPVTSRTLPAVVWQGIPNEPGLAATAGGPLWVSNSAVLWALDPATGAVEHTVTAGDSVSHLATSPTGAYLYTSGRFGDTGGADGEIVTQYGARDGHQLAQRTLGAVGAGTVSAGVGEVWVSFRTGMAGPAVGLSSRGLATVPHPGTTTGPSESRTSLDAMMGLRSGVSTGVLWLVDTTSLRCADPATGHVRAVDAHAWSGEEPLSVPIAAGGVLYAPLGPVAPDGAWSYGVVTISPPAACFAGT